MKENKYEAIKRAFSARLQALRKANHHTQSYLAGKLNLSKSCISNYESGTRIPDMDVISKIADIYSVSIEYLIGTSKRPNHYVAEDKFIDKNRYLDLNMLSPAHQNSIIEYYELLCQKDNL